MFWPLGRGIPLVHCPHKVDGKRPPALISHKVINRDRREFEAAQRNYRLHHARIALNHLVRNDQTLEIPVPRKMRPDHVALHSSDSNVVAHNATAGKHVESNERWADNSTFLAVRDSMIIAADIRRAVANYHCSYYRQLGNVAHHDAK
jgi:hypothetical protein